MDGVTPERNRLGQLLVEAGSSLDADGVDALIAGVLAAPPEIGASWHALVADPTPPDLAAALEARKATLAASHHDGVQAEDFARLSRAERLRLLRERLAADGRAGFVVPRADEHQGEYVPMCGQRLAWLTGFTGSAGMAVVLQDRAAVFVDGRYTLQAAAQVDATAYEIRHLIDEPAANWLATAAKKGDAIGYDPWLHTPQEVERLRAASTRRRDLAATANPLDAVWASRRRAAGSLRPAEDFAGESRRQAHPAGTAGRRHSTVLTPRVDRLAAQHPGRRRTAHAAALSFAISGPMAGAVHRPPQAVW